MLWRSTLPEPSPPPAPASRTLRHRLAKVLTIKLLADLTDQDGDQFLKLVTGWPKLKWLSLCGAKVSDAGLVHCQGHPSLEVVSIEVLAVSHQTLASLARIPKLRMAVIGGRILSRQQATSESPSPAS